MQQLIKIQSACLLSGKHILNLNLTLLLVAVLLDPSVSRGSDSVLIIERDRWGLREREAAQRNPVSPASLMSATMNKSTELASVGLFRATAASKALQGANVPDQCCLPRRSHPHHHPSFLPPPHPAVLPLPPLRSCLLPLISTPRAKSRSCPHISYEALKKRHRDMRRLWLIPQILVILRAKITFFHPKMIFFHLKNYIDLIYQVLWFIFVVW